MRVAVEALCNLCQSPELAVRLAKKTAAAKNECKMFIVLAAESTDPEARRAAAGALAQLCGEWEGSLSSLSLSTALYFLLLDFVCSSDGMEGHDGLNRCRSLPFTALAPSFTAFHRGSAGYENAELLDNLLSPEASLSYGDIVYALGVMLTTDEEMLHRAIVALHGLVQ